MNLATSASMFAFDLSVEIIALDEWAPHAHLLLCLAKVAQRFRHASVHMQSKRVVPLNASIDGNVCKLQSISCNPSNASLIAACAHFMRGEDLVTIQQGCVFDVSSGQSQVCYRTAVLHSTY